MTLEEVVALAEVIKPAVEKAFGPSEVTGYVIKANFNESVLGCYHDGTRRIAVSSVLSEKDLWAVLTHELSHASQLQNQEVWGNPNNWPFGRFGGECIATAGEVIVLEGLRPDFAYDETLRGRTDNYWVMVGVGIELLRRFHTKLPVGFKQDFMKKFMDGKSMQPEPCLKVWHKIRPYLVGLKG